VDDPDASVRYAAIAALKKSTKELGVQMANGQMGTQMGKWQANG